MLKAKTLTVLSAGSIATLLSVAAPAVFAHTGILSLNTPPVSGGGGYVTAVTITHGCAAEGAAAADQKDPVAASAVFPIASTSVATNLSDNSNIADLSAYVEGAVGGGLPGLAPALIQSHDVWENNAELSNELGNVVAFRWTDGRMQHDLYGYQPFRVTLPHILPASCVSRLRVRVAAAEYCTKGRTVGDGNKSDIWFGIPTTLFNDPAVQPAGYYPTLTVNRPASEPLPAACGAGFEVAVQPSNADVDTYLPIKGYWPAASSR
jgi:hypothetical protein